MQRCYSQPRKLSYPHMKLKGKQVTLAYIFLDAFSLFILFNIAAYARGIIDWHPPLTNSLFMPIALHVVGVHLIDGYNPRTDMMSLTYTSLHIITLVCVLLATLLMTYVFVPDGFTIQSSRLVITVSYLGVIPVTLAYRRVFYHREAKKRQQRYFLMLGNPESALVFREECRRNQMNQVVLAATHDTFIHGGASSATPFGNVVNYLEEYEGKIDAVIIRESNSELPPLVAQRLMELQFSGVPTYTMELFHQVYWRKIPLYRLNQTWLFQEGFQIAREPVFERLKRLADICLSTVGLTLFAPIFPFIALGIWLTDQGPVFFSQERVGRNRRIFWAHKLRTMRVDAGGDSYTREGDSRITPIGRMLRATRIDELPQLWNVLRGEMSMIGPRAEWVKLVVEYESKIPSYHFRHLVKPGITGWAQVNYPYGASIDDTVRKLEYDLYYIRYYSLVLDASIVLKTIQVMLFGKGR